MGAGGWCTGRSGVVGAGGRTGRRSGRRSARVRTGELWDRGGHSPGGKVISRPISGGTSQAREAAWGVPGARHTRGTKNIQY